jgi:DNA-binding protein H-NS
VRQGSAIQPRIGRSRFFFLTQGIFMTTYSEIQKQIAELQKKAEQLRVQEKSHIIDQIRAQIKEHGLTAADLGLSASRAATRAKAGRTIKYRDAMGNTWSGGRGRKPEWVKAIVASGQDLEKFAV